MKNLISQLICIVLCSGLFACSEQTESKEVPSFETMEAKFTQVPDDTQLGVYWYWMSNNIDKEKVVADLHAMKAAGINRAYIGNIGLGTDDKYGDVPMFTEEWWDALHLAMKTAGELDIEMGLFNCPGWSQSGGPWIEEERAMRYVDAIEYTHSADGQWVCGGELEAKTNQDVRVVAYPQVQGEHDGVLTKRLVNSSHMDLSFDKPVMVRSMHLQMKQKWSKTNATLLAKVDGEFVEVENFELHRYRFLVNNGFLINPPVVLSFEEVTAQEFRLKFFSGFGHHVESVKLSALPVLERWPEKTLGQLCNHWQPVWDYYMWDTQDEASDAGLALNIDDVLDISDALQDDGTIKWNAPEGKWVVKRMIMRATGVTNQPSSPESTGLEVDKMNKEHVAFHFDAYVGEVLRRIPAEDRRTFKVVVQDSYETGGQNWTDGMIEEFEDRYDYDPVPFLPVLQGVLVGSADRSERFLWDLRRLVADKIAYDYVGGFREVCHEHGLTTWLENYGHWGFPSEGLMYGGQSDEVGGEFWVRDAPESVMECRTASSCAHIYGKDKCWVEAYTCGTEPFTRSPNDLKQKGDYYFVQGTNAIILHYFVHQPYADKLPGINEWFSTEFDRHNIWNSHLDLYVDYKKRCSYLLQQGQYVADVAYYIGEDVPKMAGITDPALPDGYQYDFINAEILLTQASVKDGKLVLESGMEYELLVLPPQDTMRPEVMAQVTRFIESGLTVLGSAPTKSPSMENYPACDKKVQSLAEGVWGEIAAGAISAKVGEGMIYEGASIEDIFEEKGIAPDFAHDTDSLLFIHRKMSSGDVYFVSNMKDECIAETVGFRVSGKQPELWNAVTGECRVLPAFKQEDGVTYVSLELGVYGSAFVVFREPTDKLESEGDNYPALIAIQAIGEPWNVQFEGLKAPEEAVRMDELMDWTTSDEEWMKYFSGTATYRTKFEMDEICKEKNIYLDLGEVGEMAKVTINGKYVGGAWIAPYRINVTDALMQGENTLEVVVVNNWINRLIGDKDLPKDEKVTWTLNAVRDLQKATLQHSGLMGPVNIVVEQ